MTSPQPIDGTPEHIPGGWENAPNVLNIKEFIPDAAAWEETFPKRDDLYDYTSFLRAAAKFPAFCGEGNCPNLNGKMSCARELATLFAHLGQETGYGASSDPVPLHQQALYEIQEIRCTNANGTSKNISSCNYSSTSPAGMNWPPQSGEQYYGRGPVQLSWNYNYGSFSNILVESEYNSKMYLLKNPDLVVEDGYVAFSSALWFYMTPQSPKPSMHDVATCYFEPSAGDKTAGIKKYNNLNGFGITTNIINGGYECGTGAENSSSKKRISYYKAWL